ncbi:MAG: DUF1343 domain-containing protein, partial [Bacilli bacterium]
IGGNVCEGNILDLEYRSFIGYYPIVQRHGMTIGELAQMFNEHFGIGCHLIIVPMEGWTRSMDFNDTSLPWLCPSPNIPTLDTAYLYNATCIFEGTNVSEGRGTTKPFAYIGAPYINQKQLTAVLNDYHLPGVLFTPITFTPTFSKHMGFLCKGVQVHIIDKTTFEAVKTGWTMLDVIRKLYIKDFKILPPYKEGGKRMLELNTGCSYIVNDVYTLSQQWELLNHDSKAFKKDRKPYLLY